MSDLSEPAVIDTTPATEAPPETAAPAVTPAPVPQPAPVSPPAPGPVVKAETTADEPEPEVTSYVVTSAYLSVPEGSTITSPALAGCNIEALIAGEHIRPA